MAVFSDAIERQQRDTYAAEWALMLTATRGSPQDIQTLSRDLQPARRGKTRSPSIRR